MERFKKLQMKRSSSGNKVGADGVAAPDDKSKGKDFSEL